METFEKVSDQEFIKRETTEILTTYNLDFLLEQRKRLETELEEINNLITQAETLKVIASEEVKN